MPDEIESQSEWPLAVHLASSSASIPLLHVSDAPESSSEIASPVLSSKATSSKSTSKSSSPKASTPDVSATTQAPADESTSTESARNEYSNEYSNDAISIDEIDSSENISLETEVAQLETSEVETSDASIKAAKNILLTDTDDEDEAPSSFEEVREPTAQAAESRYNEFDTLFRQWRETGDPSLRDRLILMNRNLVSFIARKFLDRGEMSEDIMQQGLIGLINALDNFDPSRGTRFATFATPTIMGEIRRYLRDKTWTMRVPRRLQELHVSINHRVELLTQQLDRSPTYAEIARSLGVEVEEVIEALEMPHAMEPMSIDEALPNARGEAGATISDQIGAEDADLESWNDHAILQAALEKLPSRERQVLQLVYFQEHTQLEVARQLKISQMNVSRTQRRALARLRELMNSNDI